MCMEGSLFEVLRLEDVEMHPPFSFPAGKENAPCTVEEKSAFSAEEASAFFQRCLREARAQPARDYRAEATRTGLYEIG